VEVIRTVKEKYPQVHGLMVGDGPLKNEMVSFVQQAGLKGTFTFAGYQQDVRPFISISNLLMLTSDTEGMPGVVLEAAAMSKMTIAADVGGIIEFLRNGENGLVVSKKTVPVFADNLIQLIENPSQINQLVGNAWTSVSSGFGVVDIAVRYLNFFKKL
jgi:glycosyltransferase involved in cell wall biosynthesis